MPPQFKQRKKRLIRGTLQQKFLLLCGLLVVLMAGSTSTTYFVMARKEKQRQSQQRLQVAFDMTLNDIARQAHTFSKGAEAFLTQSKSIQGVASAYAAQLLNRQHPTYHTIMQSYLLTVTEELATFARIVSSSRVILYGMDASILAMYQNSSGKQTVGISVISSSGNQTYLSLDNRSESSQMLAGIIPIPDRLFPAGVATHFNGKIPENIITQFFNEDNRLGIRAVVPIRSSEGKIVGVMTCDNFYTQEWIEQYARLSQTELNLFIGAGFSIGSFPMQTELSDYNAASSPPITGNALFQYKNVQYDISALPMRFGQQEYYQARYQFMDEHQTVYTLTASVSKDREDREIRKILGETLGVSAVSMLIVFGLSVLMSRRTMRMLEELLHVMEALALGNLRRTAFIFTRDEFGLLAVKLNEVIVRIRDISHQTKAVSGKVTTTADNILQETAQLFQMMEQQTLFVEQTREAAEQIDRFIDMVAANMGELSDITDQILLSVRQMNVVTEQVAISTNHLNHDILDISLFADQVRETSQHIFQLGTNLLTMVQETQTAIHHIGARLFDVSKNADESQELARKTLTAAFDGQHSVDVAIQGIRELKEMTSNSVGLMQNVHDRAAQMSSILDFVDEIAEKTGLLSLNASIIAAQAGEHGKGFAVIANEIRELSALTKSSTKEIYQMITALRKEVSSGVKNASDGMAKVDEGVALVGNIKHSLRAIIDQAMQSAERASSTVSMIEDTVSSSTQIQHAMRHVTDMTTTIQRKLEQEERNVQQVVESIENLSSMSQKMKQAATSHNGEAERVYEQMKAFTRNLHDISEQTHQLQNSSDLIVSAMQNIETVTDTIVQNTTTLSRHTIQQLVRQSIALQERLNVFQVE
ncbi:methyl-accepting chemotaxis sensory transducer [Candidatus Moduliflexus flocculans]|uniref:Methyl-accepting chemotaxis sensory transducer n=1 Tax=Candidatus Moduliflexus flocculans TaxID=1499966 RepID=A0A0S6VXA1_9BACT|nr:methyl-accepting chemotaxis sensory transducer [Candidatus Moduliflexus flocculans]